MCNIAPDCYEHFLLVGDLQQFEIDDALPRPEPTPGPRRPAGFVAQLWHALEGWLIAPKFAIPAAACVALAVLVVFNLPDSENKSNGEGSAWATLANSGFSTLSADDQARLAKSASAAILTWETRTEAFSRSVTKVQAAFRAGATSSLNTLAPDRPQPSLVEELDEDKTIASAQTFAPLQALHVLGQWSAQFALRVDNEVPIGDVGAHVRSLSAIADELTALGDELPAGDASVAEVQTVSKHLRRLIDELEAISSSTAVDQAALDDFQRELRYLMSIVAGG